MPVTTMGSSAAKAVGVRLSRPSVAKAARVLCRAGHGGCDGTRRVAHPERPLPSSFLSISQCLRPSPQQSLLYS